MDDAIRPSEEEFTRVLHESCRLWSSYLNAADAAPSLPNFCIDLKKILGNTPSFLGHGLVGENDQISLKCTEKSRLGQCDLLLDGYSTWKTSTGVCHLEPKEMPLQLLLAAQSRLKVQFSDNAPLSEWPAVEGLSGCDKGNYIAVLFLAWAYILSAKWAELLNNSSEHKCKSMFITQSWQSTSSHQERDVAIDIGNSISEDEACWWNAILSPDKSWKITTDYNGKTYLSPWSVSVIDQRHFMSSEVPLNVDLRPPSSDTALTYLVRFCTYNSLYGQCLAALSAALYIPFLDGKVVLLPVPRKSIVPVIQTLLSSSYADLIMEQKRYLPYYMTLSCNIWGVRSLLCSTFFNVDIECNLVSAWLNPTFATINPLVKEQDYLKLAKVLTLRQPQLAPLWLGAILMGIAKTILRDICIGLTAINLHAASWTGILQSFITLKPDIGNRETIRREDECRLLFITACGEHTRVPVYPWKPFGETRLCDTEIEVQRHAQCGNHCLEYRYWHWGYIDGKELIDTGLNLISAEDTITLKKLSPGSSDCPLDCFSESLSEGATRGIFGWLRSTGYPACEKPIYEHPWIDIESSEGDQVDDDDSDVARDIDISKVDIDEWLGMG